MVPNFCSFQLHWEWPSQWLLVVSLRIVKSPRTWRHNIYRVTEAAPYISALVSTKGQVYNCCGFFLTINAVALIQPSETTLAYISYLAYEVYYVYAQQKNKEKKSKQKKIKSMPIPVKYKIPLFLWMTKQCYINLFACNFPEKVSVWEWKDWRKRKIVYFITSLWALQKPKGDQVIS